MYEILSGQHRTYAGNEFIFRVGTPDSEWRSVLGTQLSPQVHHKMSKRLAKRLSAGFQDKESKPQVTS